MTAHRDCVHQHLTTHLKANSNNLHLVTG